MRLCRLMCGKASPFPSLFKNIWRLCLQLRGEASDDKIPAVGKAKPFRPSKRPSRSTESLLLRLLSLRLRRRPEITVSDKPRTRGIVFHRFAAGPDVFFGLFRGLDLVQLARVASAFSCNRDLALQIGAPDFRVRGFKPVEGRLGRMSVTIPGAIGDDCRFGLNSLHEVFGSRVLRSMMADLYHIRL